MIAIMLSLMMGVGAAVFIWAIFVMEKDLSPSTLQRLERIKRKTNVIESDIPQEMINLNESDSTYKVKVLESVLDKSKFTGKIKELIKHSGSNMQIDGFLFLSFMCGMPFSIMLLTPLPLLALIALPAMTLPTFYLMRKKDRRFFEFSKQFPDALNLMASSLRAGHPLFSAMDIVTDEMPTPICDVFGTARKDISLGIDTKDAFFNMTKMMPESVDLRFFITAVLIQKEVGGNLAELLDSLSGTIRERFKLMGQLRVQTAQSRIAGSVLCAVPPIIALVISFMNPDYMQPLFTTQDGKIALAIAVTLMVLGMVSIKKISTIEF